MIQYILHSLRFNDALGMDRLYMKNYQRLHKKNLTASHNVVTFLHIKALKKSILLGLSNCHVNKCINKLTAIKKINTSRNFDAALPSAQILSNDVTRRLVMQTESHISIPGSISKGVVISMVISTDPILLSTHDFVSPRSISYVDKFANYGSNYVSMHYGGYKTSGRWGPIPVMVRFSIPNSYTNCRSNKLLRATWCETKYYTNHQY